MKIITSGCFRLCSPWHIHYLTEAEKLGDLTVLMNTNESISRLKGWLPEQLDPDEVRKARLEAFGFKVVLFNGDIAPYLDGVDVFVKGGDYDIETINQVDRRLLESKGIKIVFTKRYEKPERR